MVIGCDVYHGMGAREHRDATLMLWVKAHALPGH